MKYFIFSAGILFAAVGLNGKMIVQEDGSGKYYLLRKDKVKTLKVGSRGVLSRDVSSVDKKIKNMIRKERYEQK